MRFKIKDEDGSNTIRVIVENNHILTTTPHRPPYSEVKRKIKIKNATSDIENLEEAIKILAEKNPNINMFCSGEYDSPRDFLNSVIDFYKTLRQEYKQKYKEAGEDWRNEKIAENASEIEKTYGMI